MIEFENKNHLMGSLYNLGVVLNRFENYKEKKTLKTILKYIEMHRR